MQLGHHSTIPADGNFRPSAWQQQSTATVGTAKHSMFPDSPQPRISAWQNTTGMSVNQSAKGAPSFYTKYMGDDFPILISPSMIQKDKNTYFDGNTGISYCIR